MLQTYLNTAAIMAIFLLPVAMLETYLLNAAVLAIYVPCSNVGKTFSTPNFFIYLA